MTITVGTDTYISLTDAETYIGLYYVSTDEKKAAWDALSDADKEIYLRKACASLEAVKYPGKKYDCDQTLSFPRYPVLAIPYRRNYDPDDCIWSDYWFVDDMSEVPDDVKYAQVEEAMELVYPTADSKRKQILTSSVKSKSIGHMSYTYAGAGSATGTIETVLNSIKAQELLARYANGGFSLR